MNKLIIASLALGICTSTATAQNKAVKKTITKAAAIGNKASALPAGTNFIERKNINQKVSPVDNFYEYANGAWLSANAVPPSETRWGSFNILNDYTQQTVKKILDE